MAGDAAAGKRARLGEVLGSGDEVLAVVVDVGPALGALVVRVLAYLVSRPVVLPWKMIAFILARSNGVIFG